VDIAQDGHLLILIDGIAHDVSSVMDHHPGGASYLRDFIGTDGTKAFHSEINAHSNSTANLLSTMRFAQVVDVDHER
jgi:stearoyl-CoA desaturase (delta-9 desaturase)